MEAIMATIPNTATSNGNGHTVRWIVGVLITGLLGLVGGTLTTVKSHTEKIAALEQRLDGLEKQLDKIDAKLDRLIGRRP
jgi:hypothetical protein